MKPPRQSTRCLRCMCSYAAHRDGVGVDGHPFVRLEQRAYTRRRRKRDPLAAQMGAELRAMRLAAGLSLRALARRLDTDHAWLASVERGRHEPKLSTCLEIAEACGAELAPAIARVQAGRRAQEERAA